MTRKLAAFTAVSVQALHALCQADVSLCMPQQDPASFARCLAPYLKISPADLELPRPEQRRAAERLLCILSIVSGLLGRLGRLPPEAAHDLELDLVQLINAHHFVQVDFACLMFHHRSHSTPGRHLLFNDNE